MTTTARCRACGELFTSAAGVGRPAAVCSAVCRRADDAARKRRERAAAAETRERLRAEVLADRVERLVLARLTG